MGSYTRQFAASCGYLGDNPAMLDALEQIRQVGIRAARKAHYERVKLVDSFIDDPAAFWGYINLCRVTPLLTTDEAVEFWANEAENQRVLRDTRHWRFDPGKLRMAAERVVVARYFRRFGAHLWQRDGRAA